MQRNFVLLLLLGVYCGLSQQNPAVNYSTALLRKARTAQIMAYMDESRDPCDNFYKYACGKWHRLLPAGKDKMKTSYLDQLQDLYAKKCSEMLKETEANYNAVDLKLKNFYDSCLARTQGDHSEDIKKDIMSVVNFKTDWQNFVGGWPEIKSYEWYETRYDWLKVVADIRRRLGVSILIGLEIIPDYESKELHRIKVGAPPLKLGSKAAYWNSSFEGERLQYQNSIRNTLKRYFPQMPQKWSSEIAESVVQLEKELAKGLPDNATLTLAQTTRQRYALELKSAYGSFVDLSRYFQLIFNQSIYQKVYETPAEYMTNLVEVIRETPKLTIANYTMWKVVESFEKEGLLAPPISESWCIEKVMHFFEQPLANLFHRQYNHMELTNELQSVFADIKKLFREDFSNSDKLEWISADTRARGKPKIEEMNLEIVGHEQADYEPQMRNLILNANNFNQNLINIIRWKTERDLGKLLQRPEETAQHIDLPHYELDRNKIIIPISFLQTRFFWDSSYPTALKYSSLGVLLAQEMLKGFDHIGIKYDRYGHKRLWFDHFSEKTLLQKAECFEQQYNGYKFQGKSIKDPNLLSIAITDNGAVSLAYRAYQKWFQNVEEIKIRESFELLELSQNQLFFVNYAQMFCSDYDVDNFDYKQMPEHLRVLGALSNMPDFANDFKCDRYDKMNPSKKCYIY